MASRAPLAVAIPLAVKAAASAALIASGFVAVSDDDFARLVIAERFAESPQVDPSGTSWLPAPFWLYGAALRLFGSGIGVGRVLAFICGVASIGLVYVAARWLGASARGASLGATLAALVPHSVWLGAAMVPELPAAACIVLGMAASRATCPWRIAAGAAALLFATLSRYEAWPVAVVFSILVIGDAVKRRSLVRAALGAGASLGIGAWVLHGVFVHHDALFFLHRVAHYRSALAGEAAPSLWNALRPLMALVAAEPEIVVVTAIAGVAFRRLDDPARVEHWKAALARPLALGIGLVLFLSIGATFGGEATHHEERPLLALWVLTAVVAGAWLADTPRAALARAAFGVAAPGIALIVVSRLFYPHDSFSPRDDERALGASLREIVPADGHVVIDTLDYGYFAVIAAFGAPSRAHVLDDHDPRHEAADGRNIDNVARSHGAHYAVVCDASREGVWQPPGTILKRAGALAVVQLR